jgi:alanine-glyoxylate transaminase/serine-glyoxylate transaminase/serine-pyruvate transaminase
MPVQRGWHFLQLPGPTNIPDRVVRAMSRPIIDHRGREFAELAVGVHEGLRALLQTDDPVVIYPSSGTGAWEASLVNCLSPGDALLVCENGHFAREWGRLAERLGFVVQRLEGDWRRGPDPESVESVLADDRGHLLKAVLVVHNETSTGVSSRVSEVRRALDAAGHPALLLVDTISSLGSIDYRHDEWEVDVTVAASQKGLMLPPGLGLNVVSEKARQAAVQARSSTGYWDWSRFLDTATTGSFPFTPATTLLFGLEEALAMLQEEGLPAVYARHAHLAGLVRAAAESWGFAVYALDPREYSNSLTAVLLPPECDGETLKQEILSDSNLTVGGGLGPLSGRVIRIGHLGDANELMVVSALAGVELGLASLGIATAGSGVTACLDLAKSVRKGNRSPAPA